MEKTFGTSINITSQKTASIYLKGLVWGLIGGLAGTLVMDLILMGVFFVFKMPVMTCFSIIGNTVARFFWPHAIEITNANLIGIITHYIVGPVIGMVFGLMILRFKSLRVNTLQKCILVAILYLEILSQPLLALSPILLKMTPMITLLWYAGSFLMHLVAAVMMGLVIGKGLGLVKEVKKT